jgi:hypothetical protein
LIDREKLFLRWMAAGDHWVFRRTGINVIHILWPTARLGVMKESVVNWLRSATGSATINLTIAVNTEAEAEEIRGWKNFHACNVIVTGAHRLGPVWPVHQLCKQLVAEEDDIVILATDDFLPPLGWDTFIRNRLDYCGALIINDGVRKRGDRLMTLPIMTYSCLLKINRLIVHPDYGWHFADAELYENLDALGLLRDARGFNDPVFEHLHWTKGKRKKDDVDQIARRTHSKDKLTFARRMKMTIEERLICP